MTSYDKNILSYTKNNNRKTLKSKQTQMQPDIHCDNLIHEIIKCLYSFTTKSIEAGPAAETP